jgi:hypothetical protein
MSNGETAGATVYQIGVSPANERVKKKGKRESETSFIRLVIVKEKERKKNGKVKKVYIYI